MSFQQGLSGLNATSKNLEVIGNNIANANTFGAKASRAEFADMYANALNGAGANQVGIGVQLAVGVAAVHAGQHHGDAKPDGSGHQRRRLLPGHRRRQPGAVLRNGQFKVDRNGYIVNNDGLRLIGYPADATGVIQPGNVERAAPAHLRHRAGADERDPDGDEPRLRAPQ